MTSPVTVPCYMEKGYLQSLNDRFASYVSRVREQSGRMETTNLINTTKILEDEIVALKAMYERQLEELRNKLEEMARERTQHQLVATRNSALVAELQDKWVDYRFLAKISALRRKSISEVTLVTYPSDSTLSRFDLHCIVRLSSGQDRS